MLEDGGSPSSVLLRQLHSECRSLRAGRGPERQFYPARNQDASYVCQLFYTLFRQSHRRLACAVFFFVSCLSNRICGRSQFVCNGVSLLFGLYVLCSLQTSQTPHLLVLFVFCAFIYQLAFFFQRTNPPKKVSLSLGFEISQTSNLFCSTSEFHTFSSWELPTLSLVPFH